MYSREVRVSQYQEINEIYLINKLNAGKKKNRTTPIIAFWKKIKALDKSLAAIPFKIK